MVQEFSQPPLKLKFHTWSTEIDYGDSVKFQVRKFTQVTQFHHLTLIQANLFYLMNENVKP